VDTDVVFLRPLQLDSSCKNALGIESGGGGRPLSHLATASDHGNGLPMPPTSIVCNAVMAFAAGASLLQRTITAFLDGYVPLTPDLSMPELYARGEWGAMGPLLVSRMVRDRRTKEEGATCLLEQDAFYAIAPPDISAHFEPWEPVRDTPVWERLQARSAAVHYWNALTRHLPIACDSLFKRVLDANCVTCVPVPCVL
jgi:hypothetical protein